MRSSILRAARVGELIIVLGEIGTDADLITVFDHRGLKKFIEMVCYSPSLSLDGRYVAFSRFSRELQTQSISEILWVCLVFVRLAPVRTLN